MVRNALTRKRGKDIPENFMQPQAKVVPDPSNHTLVVEIDSGVFSLVMELKTTAKK